MKIVVLDGYSVNPGDLSWKGLEMLGELNVYERTNSKQIIERCNNAEIVLTNKVEMSAKILKQLPQLK